MTDAAPNMAEGQMMRDDVSCRNILTYMSYVSEFLGQPFIPEMFKDVIKKPEFMALNNDSGRIDTLSIEYLINSSNWVSNDAHVQILRNLKKMGTNMYDLGCYTAKNLQFNRLLNVFEKRRAIEKIQDINKKLNKTEDIEIVENTKKKARIKVTHRPEAELIDEQCEYNKGYYTGLFKDFYKLEVNETSCAKKGDSYCMFEISWKGQPLFKNIYRKMQEIAYALFAPTIKKENRKKEMRSRIWVDKLYAEIERGDISYQDLRRRNFDLLSTQLRLKTALSELEDARKEVIEAEQLAAAGEWISEIVHDSRNINSGVSGEAQLIMLKLGKKHELDPEFKESIVKICRSIIDAVCGEQDMFEDILKYIRGENVTLDIKEISAKSYIDNLCNELKYVVGEEVQIKTELGYTGPIYMDQRKMTTRVINNLAKNASEAMGRKGELTIKTLKNDGYVEIWVRDNGPGIPDDVKPRLFEKFNTYGKKGGTGLGLSIAKRFVEEHKGKLDVESYTRQTIDEGFLFGKKPGTTFKIKIPYMEKQDGN